MSVDGVDKKNQVASLNKNLLNKEVAKNQPGSPKSVKLQQLTRQEEGKHTHMKPEKEEKKNAVDPSDLGGNSIPSSRFPTGAFD